VAEVLAVVLARLDSVTGAWQFRLSLLDTLGCFLMVGIGFEVRIEAFPLHAVLSPEVDCMVQRWGSLHVSPWRW
jgi:hypothetical protein